MTSVPPRCGPDAAYDRSWTTEFRKFYTHVQSATGVEPSLLNLHDDEAVNQHKPAPSPDPALTAFCQLAAMKLRVRRAMIFLFDADNGYVLAEATKSTSLRGGIHSAGNEDDELWLGNTIIPRGYSVCEHTINLPQNDGTNRDGPSASIAHIINDLSGDVRFCNRPFVTDGPRARYYAGVPVTTAAGANIGALCALHDEPRQETTEEEIATLVDLAAAIMSHLEALRAKALTDLSARRLRSLTTFLEDTSNPFEARRDHARHVQNDTSQIPTIPVHFGSTELQIDCQSQNSNIVDDPGAIPTTPCAPVAQFNYARNGIADGQANPKIDLAEASNAAQIVTKVVQHAAILIQKALDVEHVSFFDASGSRHRAKDSGMARSTSSGTNTTAEEDNTSEAPSFTESSERQSGPHDEPCIILGSACSPSHISPPSPVMSRRQLRRIARRHPYGKLWHTPHEETMSEDSAASSASVLKEADVTRPARKGLRRTADEKALLETMPGSRNVLFVPLWSNSRDNLYAGVVMYSRSPSQWFSIEVELQFMRVFCEIIMAVMARLDTQFVLQAKTTFISSISHELRTPLHGILGSVEFIKEDGGDVTQQTMLVSQIEKCGKTMLDIINQILDFSHVDRIAHQNLSSSDDALIARRPHARAARSSMVDSLSLRSIPRVSLDVVTEEVIETAIYSHYCDQSQFKPLTIILDIIGEPLTNWSTRLSIGMWKRVCVNVVVNALKYTQKGFIHISLKQQPDRLDRTRLQAILTVTDTGCGMSEAFMRNSLFQPFEQEDVLSTGSGLGMSLIKKMLKAASGKIEVKSVEGAGTTVTISLPLPKLRKRVLPLAQAAAVGTKVEAPVNLIPIYLGPFWTSGELIDLEGRRLLQVSFTNSLACLSQRLGPELLLTQITNIYFLSEVDIDWFVGHDKHSNYKGGGVESLRLLLILCNTNRSMAQCRTILQAGHAEHVWHIECLIPPYGISQIARSVKNALHKSEDRAGSPDPSPTNHKHDQVNLSENGTVGGENRSLLQSLNTESPITQSSCTNLEAFHSLSIHEETLPILDRTPGRGEPMKPTDVTSTPNEIVKVNGCDPITGPGLVLLLVDDNAINMRILTMYADRQGHTKMTAKDGLEACQLYQAALYSLNPSFEELNISPDKGVSALKTEGIAAVDYFDNRSTQNAMSASPPPWPNAVLLDINMPVMDGYQTARRIRAMEARMNHRYRTLIIAMTSLGAEEAKAKALDSGMDLFLTKPVKFKELSRILTEYIPTSL